MKRLGKTKISWTPSFAYVIGLIASDGNFSRDGRHVHFTSKDLELVLHFKQCLNLQNKIGKKSRGGSDDKKYFVVQFGDRNFHDFLLDVGLMPAKSKIIGMLRIPNQGFADFFRGCVDGDGNIDVSKHPESQHPQLKLRLYSASLDFLEWIKEEIDINFEIGTGWIQKLSGKTKLFCLSFGKADTIKIFDYIYYPGVKHYLSRKFFIAKPFMGTWRNWHTRGA